MGFALRIMVAISDVSIDVGTGNDGLGRAGLGTFAVEALG